MIDLLLSALLATQPPAVPSTPPPAPAPTLSALHQAQAEAYAAKVRVLQLEVQIRQQALEQERARLEAAITAAHPGYRIAWESGALVPVTPVTQGGQP